MKSKILEIIIDIKNKRDTEVYAVKEKFQKQIIEQIEHCTENNHMDDDGNSALIRARHPFHSGWDFCQICERYIETNPYGRDE